MCRCGLSASRKKEKSSSAYSHNELHRRLVDSSSVASVGSLASRCRSCPHLAPMSAEFVGLLFLIFLLTIPYRFSMGFRSGEFAGQSNTPKPWSFKQLLVLLAMWAGDKSCWKMKSASLKSWSAERSMKRSKMYW